MNEVKVIPSSIFPADANIQYTKENQFKLPTWGVILILVVCFLILKTLIYIKDEKRHGQ